MPIVEIAENWKEAADIVSGRVRVEGPEDSSKYWIIPVGKSSTLSDTRLETFIVEHYPCFRAAGGVMHWYSGGIYVPDVEGSFSKTLIRMHLPESYQRINTLNNIYKLLLSDERIAIDSSEINNYPETAILFKNGVFNPATGKMEGHSYAHYALGGLIPFEYHPDEKIPEGWGRVFEKFAAEAFESAEDRLSCLEFVGNACSRYCGFEKNLWLQGTGNTGKSVIIKTITHIVGKENHSSLSLHQMTENFFKIQLLGKLLNACTDLDARSVEFSGDFKKIISGEEITDSYKGRQNFSFSPFAKHLFSANELPQVSDRSTGFYRRLIILTMNHVPAKPDLGLTDKLTSDESTAYIIDRAVKAYAEALKRGNMTISENAKEAVIAFRKSNDSVTAFWEECIEQTKSVLEEERVTREELFLAYQDFCKAEEYQPVKKKNLFKVLREQRGLKDGKSGDMRFFKDIKFVKGTDTYSAIMKHRENMKKSGSPSALKRADETSGSAHEVSKRAGSALDSWVEGDEYDVPFA